MKNKLSLDDKISKVLQENSDGNLGDSEFRRILCSAIMGVIHSHASGSRIGATVLTPEASLYNPKKDGPKGPTPKNI